MSNLGENGIINLVYYGRFVVIKLRPVIICALLTACFTLAAAARALPGVKAVLTGADAPAQLYDGIIVVDFVIHPPARP